MADLFGNSTMRGWQGPGEYALEAAKVQPPAQWGRNILSLFGMMNEMQANSLPPPRKDAPTQPATTATPAVTTGPDIQIGQNKPWMPTSTQLAAAPYTNGVSTVAPPIQDAPAYGFREPTNWDGSPKTSWLQSPEPRSFRANSSTQLAEYLLDAQQLPPSDAINRISEIRSANSDWMTRNPVQKMFSEAEKNVDKAQTYLHQRNMEKVAQQGRDIQLGAATGIAKQYSDHMGGINKVLGNANQDERAIIAQIQGKETIKGVGGFPVLDPEAVSMLGTVTAAQNARLAADANAKAAELAKNSGQVPSTTRLDPKTGQPVQSFARPLASATKAEGMPQGIKDQRSEIAAKKRLLESELGQLKRSMVDTTGKDLAEKKAQAIPLEKQIADLGNQWKFLGTNWGNSATAPAKSAPMAMPTSKNELKNGQLYQTSRGPATWDGTQFVK